MYVTRPPTGSYTCRCAIVLEIYYLTLLDPYRYRKHLNLSLPSQIQQGKRQLWLLTAQLIKSWNETSPACNSFSKAAWLSLSSERNCDSQITKPLQLITKLPGRHIIIVASPSTPPLSTCLPSVIPLSLLCDQITPLLPHSPLSFSSCKCTAPEKRKPSRWSFSCALTEAS